MTKRSPSRGDEGWFRKECDGQREESLEDGIPGKGKPSFAASLAAAESLPGSDMVTLMKLGFFRMAFLDALLDRSGGVGCMVPRMRSALDPGSENGEWSWPWLGALAASGLKFFSSLAFLPGKGKENLKVRGISTVNQDVDDIL